MIQFLLSLRQKGEEREEPDKTHSLQKEAVLDRVAKNFLGCESVEGSIQNDHLTVPSKFRKCYELTRTENNSPLSSWVLKLARGAKNSFCLPVGSTQRDCAPSTARVLKDSPSLSPPQPTRAARLAMHDPLSLADGKL